MEMVDVSHESEAFIEIVFVPLESPDQDPPQRSPLFFASLYLHPSKNIGDEFVKLIAVWLASDGCFQVLQLHTELGQLVHHSTNATDEVGSFQAVESQLQLLHSSQLVLLQLLLSLSQMVSEIVAPEGVDDRDQILRRTSAEEVYQCSRQLPFWHTRRHLPSAAR